MNEVYDKNGVAIQIGDLLKIFHFTGPRRKKNYLYKFVQGSSVGIACGTEYLEINHLNLKRPSHYKLAKTGHTMEDYEIIQGPNLEDRKKNALQRQSKS